MPPRSKPKPPKLPGKTHAERWENYAPSPDQPSYLFTPVGKYDVEKCTDCGKDYFPRDNTVHLAHHESEPAANRCKKRRWEEMTAAARESLEFRHVFRCPAEAQCHTRRRKPPARAAKRNGGGNSQSGEPERPVNPLVQQMAMAESGHMDAEEEEDEVGLMTIHAQIERGEGSVLRDLWSLNQPHTPSRLRTVETADYDGVMDREPLEEFHKFPQLPKELREMVLLASVPTVEIEGSMTRCCLTPEAIDKPHMSIVLTHMKRSESESGSLNKSGAPIRTFSDIPLYQLDKESRELAIRHFGEPNRNSFPFNHTRDWISVGFVPGCISAGTNVAYEPQDPAILIARGELANEEESDSDDDNHDSNDTITVASTDTDADGDIVMRDQGNYKSGQELLHGPGTRMPINPYADKRVHPRSTSCITWCPKNHGRGLVHNRPVKTIPIPSDLVRTRLRNIGVVLHHTNSPDRDFQTVDTTLYNVSLLPAIHGDEPVNTHLQNQVFPFFTMLQETLVQDALKSMRRKPEISPPAHVPITTNELRNCRILYMLTSLFRNMENLTIRYENLPLPREARLRSQHNPLQMWYSDEMQRHVRTLRPTFILVRLLEKLAEKSGPRGRWNWPFPELKALHVVSAHGWGDVEESRIDAGDGSQDEGRLRRRFKYNCAHSTCVSVAPKTAI